MQFSPLKQNACSTISFIPKDGAPVPKHVGVSIPVTKCILLSVFAGRYIDCQNMHSMNNIKCSTMSPRVLNLYPSPNVKDEILNFSSIKRNTCPVHLTFLKFIAAIIIGKKYKYWIMRDFRLPPRIKWDLRPSGILCSLSLLTFCDNLSVPS